MIPDLAVDKMTCFPLTDMIETVLLQHDIKGTLPVRLVYRSIYCVFTGELPCRGVALVAGQFVTHALVVLAHAEVLLRLTWLALWCCSFRCHYTSFLRRPDGFHWVSIHNQHHVLAA